ncbi:HNH endonuclease [Cupriavidus basilensis]|uniref:HNH endonuclease n=1 Tax=Cupriavidus basilensis TaxID=68895 RepID=UPI0020A67825|nr:HNH endonuclease [Cupriavidus basilensis]MCP3019632.1 HNH endonuclease [Cupriavidus basilensis]
MMQTTEDPREPAIRNTIVTGSLDDQSEQLAATIAFAIEFAQQGGAPLALNAAKSHRSQLLALLTPATVESLTAGETVHIGSGPSLDLIDDQAVGNFVGLVLFVGVDAARLALLKAHRVSMIIAVPQTNEERAAILDAFPDAGRLDFRPEPEAGPLPEMTQSHASKLQWLAQRYDMLAANNFDRKSAEVVLGAGEPQVCRYCGKSAPDVAFDNISHAFPEQIGNKWLIDSRECDVCNTHFASAVDAPFGDWSLLARSTGRIRGKKKVPTFVASDSDFRIDVKNGNLKLTVRNGDPRLKFDDKAKRIEMRLERPPYIPMGVFKSFVKMALAVMPEPEASKCQHLKDWILEKKHTFESFPFHPLMLYSQFIAGPVPNDKISFMLVRRKASVSGCPYLMFMVQYGNHVHQIALPMPKEDGMGQEPVQTSLVYFPHPWETADHIEAYGPARPVAENLSSPDFRRNEPYPMHFTFAKAIDTTPAKAD